MLVIQAAEAARSAKWSSIPVSVWTFSGHHPVGDPVLIDSSTQETVMNQAAFENFARWHRQDLLHEADHRRLAAVSSDRDAAVHGGGASAWRRQIGWALIDLGARLSGGYLESGVDRA
jgi:hypothetical protein